jgi:hypothetical protein
VRSSSIFSFETLAGLPRFSRAAWLALGLSVAARAAIYLASEAFFLIPENDFDKLYLINEAAHRLSEGPRPKVVVMGTSRLGILPGDRLGKELGVEPEEVANYSLAGNSFWRTLAFFRRNPEVLEEARVVVLDLLPYQLYVGRLFTEEDELFLRLATLEERSRVRSPLLRAKAFADLAFPVWSERHNPEGWRRGLRLATVEPLERYRLFLEAASQSAASVDLRREVQEMEAATDPRRGAGYAPPPRVSEVQVEALRELADLLPDDCRLLLAWLPVRQDFAAALRSDPVMGASYRTFKEFLGEFRHPRARLIWLDNAEGEYLPSEAFTDVVHYTPDGIDTVCDLIADALKKQDTPPGEALP